jgi:hypothetical protein
MENNNTIAPESIFIESALRPDVHGTQGLVVYGTFQSKEGSSDGKEGGSDGNECGQAFPDEIVLSSSYYSVDSNSQSKQVVAI